MNSKVRLYITDALAACGFVVIDYQLALCLREDLWSSAANAWSDMCDARTKIEQFLRSLVGVTLFEIQFADEENWLLVATRCDDILRDRIRWITGQHVTAIREYRPVRHQADATALRSKDETPIPPWPCVARTEALEKANLLETKFARPAGGKYR